MKEVGLNTTSQSQNAQRITEARAQRSSEMTSIAPTDSIEANLTRTPDFSQVEQDTESRFDSIKSRLKEEVKSEHYPPLETIKALSRMLAGDTENGESVG